MAVKLVEVDGLGQVKLVKRRGAKSLRLSVTHDGLVRVSMPTWVPFKTGVNFAKQKRLWLIAQLAARQSTPLKNGDRIGKHHRITYRNTANDSVTTRVAADEVRVRSARAIDDAAVQLKLRAAAERALKAEAEQLFPKHFSYLAAQHGFTFEELRIKKMRSRWGSCSSKKVIVLSIYLVQLPWPLINYVMIHELLHTRHMHHGPDFWKDFESIIPKAKLIRREINKFKPQLLV